LYCVKLDILSKVLHRLDRPVLFINVLILKAVVYRVFVDRPPWFHTRYHKLRSIVFFFLFFGPCIFNNEDKNKPTKCTN